ncbi:MAG TPA: VWA domain-containing protein [Gemmataceae bacterium]|jgi:Ca-activated chloride channel family protein|nr:VWA domain-containing protein [Gemmataceae bacterium]
MPSFAYPWFLLLLPLVPLLVWWQLRRRVPALRYSDPRLLASLPAGRGRWVRPLEAGLHSAALLALILALAGPRWPKPVPITTEGIAIVLAVDVSGSMSEVDFGWDGRKISRLEAVKRAFRLFVQGGTGPDGQALPGRRKDLIGLVMFATYPDATAPLTLSHRVLVQLLDTEQPRPLDEAHTNIGDAIAEGLLRLDQAGDRRKVLVLLTDGEHNFPGPANAPTWTPLLAARRAADLNIPVYTIDAGNDEGASDPETRKAGKEALQEVARMTGGESFSARDADSLLKVCQQIDRLERRPIPSPYFKPYRELHWVFGLASALLLLSARLVSFTVGRRLP